MKKPLFISLICLCSIATALAQSANDSINKQNTRVSVTMDNGDNFNGFLIDQNDTILLIHNENGKFILFASHVKKLNQYTISGKFGFENPHDTRYFFGPTAIPIGKKEGYYQNVLVAFNFVNVGITKNISIGGGFEFISTVLGSPIGLITPKIGFQVAEKLYLGAGIFAGGMLGETGAGMGYGVITYGQPEANISFGTGYAILPNEESLPVFMFSAFKRTGRTVGLMTENYFFNIEQEGLIYLGMHGLRLMSNKNSFDIGAVVISEIIDEVPALPFVGYSRVF